MVGNMLEQVLANEYSSILAWWFYFTENLGLGGLAGRLEICTRLPRTFLIPLETQAIENLPPFDLYM